MGHKHHPRRGSLQYWPHVRSRKHAPRIKSWADSREKKLLGFIGYKAGMTHVLVRETNNNSPRKQMEVFTPVTVVECPPVKVYSIRYYLQDEDRLKLVSEIFSKKVEKEFERKTKPSKKEGKIPEVFDVIKATLYTQPKIAGIGKKKPDLVEIGIGGKDLNEKSEFAQSLLDKEVKVSEVFKGVQFVDVHSVTKGKGFCGATKKFGPKRLQHKSEKGTRGIGTLGPWHPNKVLYTVAQAGKWGYHLRTEYNKMTLKIGNKPEEINPKGGFLRYGLVKSDYLLIKGSLPGATKRPVVITDAIRIKDKIYPSPITYISLESKQR